MSSHRKLYCKVLGITFAVSAILLIATPNYYKCTVMLAPELSGNNGSGSLASLVSRFDLSRGGSVGSVGGSEALFPTLYPDLMNSVTFRASLFPITVHRDEDDTSMTYYDYLHHEQKKSLLEYAMLPLAYCKGFVESLIFPVEEASGKVNPFKLTKEQFEIVELMEKKVVCDVDDKTFVITIEVTDQDPLIAATMADSVQVHLQEFITDYRTKKARIDLAHCQQQFREARQRYEEARLQSAAYNDANQHVFLDRVRSEQIKLTNEMKLQFQAYSEISSQLRMAEAKVQEDTPAFTLLQPATVPVRKAGPKRMVICLMFLFLAFIATTVYVLNKTGSLKAVLGSLRRSSSSSDLFDDEEYYVLSKYPPHPQGHATAQE